MRRQRFLIYILILCLFVFSGPFAVGFMGGTDFFSSFGGCAGFNLSGNLGGDEEEESGSAGFDAGFPVDIPVTVAKNVGGIDPTSITFEAVSSPFLTRQARTSFSHDQSNPIGFLSASTISGEARTVLLFDGATGNIIHEAFGSTVTFTITNSEVDLTMGLQALCPGCASDDPTSSGSYPIGLEINELDGDFVLTIFVTLMAAGGSEFAGTIQNAQLATFNPIAFFALDRDENPAIFIVDTDGSAPEKVTNVDNAIYGLAADFNDDLYAFDAVTNALFTVDTDDGSITDLDSISFPTGTTRASANHPTGNLIAFTTGPDFDLDVGLMNLTTGVTTVFPIEDAPDDVVLLAWTGNSRFLMFVSSDAGANRFLVEFNLAPLFFDLIEGVEQFAHLVPSGSITELVGDSGYRGQAYLVMDGEVFRYESGGTIVGPIISGDFDAAQLNMAADGRGFTFTKVFDPDDPKSNVIAFYDVESATVQNVIPGVFSVPAAAENAFITALFPISTTNDLQVILSTDFFVSDPVSLGFVEAPNVSTDYFATIFAEGGVPPYSYSVAGGGGTIDANLALFQAPATTGTTTVRVEDSAGNTSDLSVPIVDPGTLDRLFNDDGIFSSDASGGGRKDFILDVAYYSNQSEIFTVGPADNGSNDDFAVMAISRDGTLNTSFGTNGKTIIDFGSSDEGNAIALDEDGKIVVAGAAITGNNWNFTLARLNTDGTVDTTFGSNGKVTTDLGTDFDKIRDVAIQSDGKIVVVGVTGVDPNGDFAVARYNSDGSLDTTFGDDGIVTTDIGGAGSQDEANALVLEDDDQIIVGGISKTGLIDNFAFAKYNSDGSLDTNFSSGGKFVVATSDNDELESMVLQEGLILAAGNTDPGGSPIDVYVVRIFPEGLLDTSFDGDGKLTFNLTPTEGQNNQGHGIGYDRVLNKIVVNGTIERSGTDNDMFIVRLNSDGSFDTTFGSSGDGSIITILSSSFDNVFGLLIQETDRKILSFGASTFGVADVEAADSVIMRHLP